MELLEKSGLPGEKLTPEQSERVQSLGVDVRAICYSILLEDDCTFLQQICKTMPVFQRTLFWFMGPTVKARIKNGYVKSPQHILERKKTLQENECYFEQLLSLDAAEGEWDLTLNPLSLSVASLYAPLVNPETYAKGNGWMIFPAFDTLPREYQMLIETKRQTPLGKFTLKMYEKHR